MSRAEHDRLAAEAMARTLGRISQGTETLIRGLGQVGERARAVADALRTGAVRGPQCGRTPDTPVCPAHGPHPHHGMVCLDCPQCATGQR